MDHPITGVLAASVTPLTEDGDRLDEKAFGPLCDFFAGAGIDGLLVMGTTGEGVLMEVTERQRIIDLFLSAADGRLKVIAHCGAQSTRDTVTLAVHAAHAGAAGVAVISPPYFPFDSISLLDHHIAAARACAPLPYYVYELAARSGYAVPVRVIEELRTSVDNLAGIKVSDTPWSKFEPYLIDGLSVFVRPESLISQGMHRGAVGAVSALATCLPELVIDAVRSGLPEASKRCADIRDALQRFPLHSAMKTILARRDVPVTAGVRPPLRRLTREELIQFEPLVERVLTAAMPGPV